MLTVNGFAQAPNYVWAKSAGGSFSDCGNSIAVDSSGNSYVTGYFYSLSIAFGSTTFSNANGPGIADMFIVKYDTSGNVVWAKFAGGSSDVVGNSIAVDASGNSYVTGYFYSPSITLGSNTLTNADTSLSGDIFIVKYDASGNVVWAKSVGGSSDDEGMGITVDTGGNSYVTGYFYSPSITFGSNTLTNTDTSGNTSDVFIVKYDASGNAVWAKSGHGSSPDLGNSIAVDASGNSYVTGYFQGTSITFGSTTLTNLGGTNIFIVKYDASGNVVWAHSAGGNFFDLGYGIAVDAGGNSYVTGYFTSPSITFGSTTLTNADVSGNTADVFIVKYDTSGNPVWAKSGDGSSDDVGNSIAVDAGGNSYITGYFISPSITFGSTTLTNVDTSGQSWNMFIVKYDTSGNLLWVKSAGVSNNVFGYGIAVDGNSSSYVTGYFGSLSITFGSTTLTNDTAGGTSDIFIVKLNPTSGEPLGVSEINHQETISIYPNPTTSSFTISTTAGKIKEVKVFDVVGEIVNSQQGIGNSQCTIDMKGVSKGIYFVQIMYFDKLSMTNVVNKKVVVQ